MLGLGWSVWDLVPWPGVEPRPSALGAQSLSPWTAKEVLRLACFQISLQCRREAGHQAFQTLLSSVGPHDSGGRPGIKLYHTLLFSPLTLILQVDGGLLSPSKATWNPQAPRSLVFPWWYLASEHSWGHDELNSWQWRWEQLNWMDWVPAAPRNPSIGSVSVSILGLWQKAGENWFKCCKERGKVLFYTQASQETWIRAHRFDLT